jgi:hypothetical protein
MLLTSMVWSLQADSKGAEGHMSDLTPRDTGDDTDETRYGAVGATRGYDLSREVPTTRADLPHDWIVFEGALPFGIRWLFGRSLRRRDRHTEHTLRLFLVLVAMMAAVAAATTILALTA